MAELTRREFVQGIGSLGLAATAQPAGGEGTVHSRREPFFLEAKPVWPARREEEKNLTAGFRAVFQCEPGRRPVLRIAASTIYRCFLNGTLCGYGPARAGHGFYRVDEWDPREFIRPGKNVLAVEVAGYNVNSYYLLDQPSFLQAELSCDNGILAATGSAQKPFEAVILGERVQKVQRYSFQRPFSEIYHLEPQFDQWRTDPALHLHTVNCDSLPAKQLLPRHVPNPQFNLRQPVWIIAEGAVETGFKPAKVWKDRSLTAIGPKLKGYPQGELAEIPSIELQTLKTLPGAEAKRAYSQGEPLRLQSNSYAILDLGTDLTGFLGAKITARGRTRLFFTFDEVLSQGDVDFKRMDCVNIVLYEVAAGTYRVEAFEPYTLRYLKLIVLEGECEVEGLYLREYANPNVDLAHFASSDERLNRLFAAGRETYRQNAVDLFTDCPSRERGGWLCDSYFTGQVAPLLSGDTTEERNFLENFLLPESFAYLPPGMLPMCYPADHNDGNFIPNWAMWFVLQLEGYQKRTGDLALVEGLRPKLLKLFEYFRPFKNSDGLLEKLTGWVFVEWSHANDFVQDVNYPTNMLYAAMLEAAANMYGLPALREESEELRAIIRKQSYDGKFFVDNAVRRDGKLQVTQNHSEVCQYFAYYFGIATPATYPELWRTLREEFGPRRSETHAFPDVKQVNAFVGNMMRLEVLSRAGLGQQILDESISYLLYMAERTGTLWENVGASASCNHAFASHIITSLYRDVLGLYQIDSVHKVVHLRFPDVQLSWCEGEAPLAGGRISLAWRKEGNKNLYRLAVPAGYTLALEGNSEMWVRES